METPAEPLAREELVKNLMADAVENTAGRPSVEAPLQINEHFKKKILQIILQRWFDSGKKLTLSE